MKRLTINRVARANLKFHRKAYISLLTGIFLAVYLVSATGMCLWGMFQAREAQMARQVGWLDAILPDSPQVSDDQLREKRDVQQHLLERVRDHFRLPVHVNNVA